MSIFEKISDEKRKKVIETAMGEFAEHGYELASTNRIVKDLGISKGSLFKYFESKLSLYMYLAEYATKYLTGYMDSNLHLDNKNNWRTYLLHYAGVEYDYLISEPLKYRFFRNIVKDINQKALSEVRDDLLRQTNNYLASIRQDLKIDDQLFRHLFFVIKGYNEYYLEITDVQDINEGTKEDYLTGLNKHFDYVKE